MENISVTVNRESNFAVVKSGIYSQGYIPSTYNLGYIKENYPDAIYQEVKKVWTSDAIKESEKKQKEIAESDFTEDVTPEPALPNPTEIALAELSILLAHQQADNNALHKKNEQLERGLAEVTILIAQGGM